MQENPVVGSVLDADEEHMQAPWYAERLASARTVLDRLNLTDHFLFDETMEIPEAYQAAVEILVGRRLKILTQPETEKELRVSPELRQIRLDVISMDEEGKIYHTEMQKQNTHNLRRRSRYYVSHVDVSLLEPGCVDFELLNDVTMIMVSPFDLFGYGKYRYTFRAGCDEIPELKLEDGSARIFINTCGTDPEGHSQEFLDFMNYINETTDEVAARTDSDRIKLIHQCVRKVRASEKMGVKYMLSWEERVWARRSGHEEGLAEGRASGLEEGCRLGQQQKTVEQICRKLRKGQSVEMISEALEEDIELIRSICKVAWELAPEYRFDQVWDAYMATQTAG